jgi:hypothetical protein
VAADLTAASTRSAALVDSHVVRFSVVDQVPESAASVESPESVDSAVDSVERSFAVDREPELTGSAELPEPVDLAVARRFFVADLPVATLAWADSRERAGLVVVKRFSAAGSLALAVVAVAERIVVAVAAASEAVARLLFSVPAGRSLRSERSVPRQRRQST